MNKPVKSLCALCFCLSLGLLMTMPILGQQSRPQSQPVVRFVPLDIFIDSGDQPLAAYQFELQAPAESFAIVGIEGGKHKAFAPPPYYDPAALAHHRVIIAAFNTGPDLPTGKTRVARIHARIIGEQDPDFELKLTAAASAEGRDIDASITIVQGGQP